MITMMISIVPSDMALSPKGGRRMEIRHPAEVRKAQPGLWFQRGNRGGCYSGGAPPELGFMET